MKIRGFHMHLIAALAGVAACHLAWHDVAYKIADQVMVRADGAGIAALVAEHPAGVLDWCARLLAATDLAGWGILVQLALVAAAGTFAFLALRHRGSPYAPLAPWLAAALATLPALSLELNIWFLPQPHFVQLHLLWFSVLAGCLFAGLRGLVGFAALQILLLALGSFAYGDLPVAETLRRTCSLPVQFEWDVRSAGVVLVFAALAAAAFVRRPAVLPRWAHAVPPALVLVVFLLSLPSRDCRDQVKMERAIRESRFADVLEVAPHKARPERMETAWRILAMFRTDRLDRDLRRYPVVDSYRDTPEEEMVLEGPLLLFHYGLLMPARRWTFESAAIKGWQPQYFRMLGDIALMTGEEALARKNYAELARCPFRGDFARARLAALDTKKAPPDLVGVAAIHRDWNTLVRQGDAPRYVNDDRIVERTVYGLMTGLQGCPSAMLKLCFAVALLNGQPEFLKLNRDAVLNLYPDGKIGPVFLEALR